MSIKIQNQQNEGTQRDQSNNATVSYRWHVSHSKTVFKMQEQEKSLQQTVIYLLTVFLSWN